MTEVIQYDPGDQRRSRCKDGVDEGEGSRAVRGKRTPTVKPEPPEPEQSRAKQHEGYVVGQQRLAAVVFSRAQEKGRHDRRRSGVDVNDGAAGEVERAELRQPSTAPYPVRDRSVHEQNPENYERQVRTETHTFDDGAGNERHGDDGERTLEAHEKQVRDRAEGFQADVIQQGHRKTTAQQRPLAESQGVADQRPQNTRHAERGKAHHHRVESTLRSYEPPVEKGQGRRHEQDERSRYE